MTLGTLVLGLGAFVSLLLTALLAFPVTVRARGQADEEQLWGQLRAAWAWGLASVSLSPKRREIRLFGLRLPRRTKRKRAAVLVRQLALALPAPVRIAIEPEYLDPVVRLRSTLVVRLWPGEMLFIVLHLMARRDVRRAIRALRS